MTPGHRALNSAQCTGFGAVSLEAAQWDTLTPAQLAEKLTTATVEASQC